MTNKEKDLDQDDFLARYVTWSLWALAVIVSVATVTGQVESYNGLYVWFATHHVTGIWADFGPLAIDSFTVIGELAIFAGIARHWDWKSRILPWASAMLGIVSSVAANVGDKVQYHSVPTDLTGAIFPLAGAFGIVIGLGVLKRVARDVALKAKIRRESAMLPLMVSTEGLKELENEEFDVPLVHLETPQPQSPKPFGLDALIPFNDSWEGIVQPTGPMPAVNEDMEERHLAHPRFDRGKITQTDSFPAVT